ncbi:MAG: SHOCT domain-containing protein [Candidatus Diapherotrites archaeon]|nr:SHOCT domain-containing protein [Candidatus Diapherotrites archaeon]MDZ4256429.1 SHOCT domain-containing protein [archaeon]
MASTVVRVIWFILIGWWVALLWVILALIACLTIIGLPVGLWMFGKTWKIATLAEDPAKIVAGVTQQIQQVTVVNNTPATTSIESPLIVLKRKYADGEITKEEYEERKEVLSEKGNIEFKKKNKVKDEK